MTRMSTLYLMTSAFLALMAGGASGGEVNVKTPPVVKPGIHVPGSGNPQAGPKGGWDVGAGTGNGSGAKVYPLNPQPLPPRKTPQ